MEGVDILHGDILRELDHLPDDYFDAILTDPPYGLNFMGKKWDYDVPSVAVWKELLRVLKPGAPILAFGGSRTFHRLVCAAEDGGVEVRDVLMWIYGSGFPKSLDVSKALDKAAGAEREVLGLHPCPGSTGKRQAMGDGWQEAPTISAPSTDIAKQWAGYGTALKPAYEPVLLGRKPMDGTVANNVSTWGVGGLAIDATRVGYASEADQSRMSAGVDAIRARGGVMEGSWKNSSDLSGANPASALGRWPANVILDEAAGAMLDEQSGKSCGGHGGGSSSGEIVSQSHGYARGFADGRRDIAPKSHWGTGGASRFFYSAKCSKKERNAGTEGNGHPTVKPIALGRYLAKLILPPKRDDGPRRLLVPFAGSGSEVIAARLEGWEEVTCIEREAAYVEIIKARVAHWSDDDAQEGHDEQQEKLFG